MVRPVPAPEGRPRGTASRAPIGDLLSAAGLVPSGHGHWTRRGDRLLGHLAPRGPVCVGAMVPDEPLPARAAGEDPRALGAASLMPPMVLTVLDDAPLALGALDPSDRRRRTVRVAGAASLLLTKALLAPGDDLERALDRLRASRRAASLLDRARDDAAGSRPAFAGSRAVDRD